MASISSEPYQQVRGGGHGQTNDTPSPSMRRHSALWTKPTLTRSSNSKDPTRPGRHSFERYNMKSNWVEWMVHSKAHHTGRLLAQLPQDSPCSHARTRTLHHHCPLQWYRLIKFADAKISGEATTMTCCRYGTPHTTMIYQHTSLSRRPSQISTINAARGAKTSTQHIGNFRWSVLHTPSQFWCALLGLRFGGTIVWHSERVAPYGLSTERPMQWLSSPAAFGCPLWHTMSTTSHVRKPLPPMSRPTWRSRRPSSTWAFGWRRRKPNRPILNKKSWASSFNIKNKLSRSPPAHNGPAGCPPSYKRSWTATTWTQILPTALLVSSCSCRRPPLDRLVKPHWLQSMLVQPIRPLNHTTCWLTPYEPPSKLWCPLSRHPSPDPCP